jgi:hypothetical protein
VRRAREFWEEDFLDVRRGESTDGDTISNGRTG